MASIIAIDARSFSSLEAGYPGGAGGINFGVGVGVGEGAATLGGGAAFANGPGSPVRLPWGGSCAVFAISPTDPEVTWAERS